MTSNTNPYSPHDHVQVSYLDGGTPRVQFGSPDVEHDTTTARALAAAEAAGAQVVSKPQITHNTYNDIPRPDDPILSTARTPDGSPSTRFEDRDTVTVDGVGMQIRMALNLGYLRRLSNGDLTSGK